MPGLSINEMTTFRWSFEEDVERYSAAGVDAIGVWRQKLADFGEDRGIEFLSRSGLRASNLLWAGGFTGSDGRSHQESLSDARDALQLASSLHAGHLVVYSGARNGHTQNHARRLFIDALCELVPMAEKAKVALAIEPMHAGCAEDWTFITCLDEAMSVIDDVGSPWVKLAFDTYHLGHDPGVVQRIAQICPRIGVVHLGDSKGPPDREQNRHRLGDGILPLKCIVKALLAAGYDGYFDVELVGEEIECCDYGCLLEGSRKAFDRLIAG